MRWLDSFTGLNQHEFEQTPGDSEGQGSLACYSPWSCKESDMTELLNNNNFQESEENLRENYIIGGSYQVLHGRIH